ncbi:hypothetical protein [Acidaminococcus fermentans]|uniref:hypothetical protein n=1 Tax=Acidaminococcus fermentans TaxID=905 RepID=UPI00307A9BFF
MKFKFNECDDRHKRAWVNLRNAMRYIVGNWENQLNDSDPDSTEYDIAQKALADHEGLVQEIYEAAITDIYSNDGNSKLDKSNSLKDIRFCGADWMKRLLSCMLKREGY